MAPHYALFQHGRRVSKIHPHIRSVGVEAIEAGAVVRHSGDCKPMTRHTYLAPGYEIRTLFTKRCNPQVTLTELEQSWPLCEVNKV